MRLTVIFMIWPLMITFSSHLSKFGRYLDHLVKLDSMIATCMFISQIFLVKVKGFLQSSHLLSEIKLLLIVELGFVSDTDGGPETRRAWPRFQHSWRIWFNSI